MSARLRSPRLLTPADYRAMPWANGRGTTVEMAREDTDDGVMLWRLSRASVDQDGAFSLLPGIDRTLMLLDGPGLTLDFGDFGGIRLAKPFERAHFSGDWNTHAREVAGPCQDLNIMTARHQAHAAVDVCRDQTFHDRTTDRTLLLAWGGLWTADVGTVSLTLPDQHLLVIDGTPGLRINACGTGALIVIGIELAV